MYLFDVPSWTDRTNFQPSPLMSGWAVFWGGALVVWDQAVIGSAKLMAINAIPMDLILTDTP